MPNPCAICHNSFNNQRIVLSEMMFGFKDQFIYFQCADCKCIQIKEIPANIEKYYPKNYYSFQTVQSKIKRSFFRKIQFEHITAINKNIIGSLFSIKYKKPQFYNWLQNLNALDFDTKILDIGSGSGELLKKLYRIGFNNLTGIDPFIDEDVYYDEHLKLLKRSVFDLQETYDVIMMHHSLEHIEDQTNTIKKIYSLLHKNSRLIIRIPVVSAFLMSKYNLNVISLDAPRHFYIHSIKSINYLLDQNGFSVYKTDFDSTDFAFIGSEQYMQDISMYDERSYFVNKNKSVFTAAQIKKFKEMITELNYKQASDNVALYIKKN